MYGNITQYTSSRSDNLDISSAIRMLEVTINSEAISARELFDNNFRSCINCFGYNEDKIFKMCVSFAEAYSNALAHGNKALEDEDFYLSRGRNPPENVEQNKLKPIKISATLTNSFVLFGVKDEGEGFDDSQKPTLELLATHGRGRFMINTHSDYSFYSNDHKTQFFYFENEYMNKTN